MNDYRDERPTTAGTQEPSYSNLPAPEGATGESTQSAAYSNTGATAPVGSPAKESGPEKATAASEVTLTAYPEKLTANPVGDKAEAPASTSASWEPLAQKEPGTQAPAPAAAPASPGTAGAGSYSSAGRQPTPPPVGTPGGYQSQYGSAGNSGYYGSYYSGPYYGQGAQHTQGMQGAGYQSSGSAAPPYNNYTPATASGYGTAQAATKTKTKGFGVLQFIAMLVLCGLVGFGGGLLAYNLNGGTGQTVVYRSAEAGTTNRTNTVENLSVSDIAATAGESVVSITTENIVTNPLLGGQVESGAGSGVIISQDGYIITNNHVIAGADSIIVTLPDGTDAEATLVGTDATSDVAVIKIDAEGLVPAIIGDSDQLAVGDLCLAIGNPMGTLGGTVTDGIISAMNREVTIDNTTMSLLQMSAAVSPGNSGGGLFNANAELIGIVNAKSGGESTEGLGFAIPINTAMRVAQDLIDHGYVTGRPALGVRVIQISSAEQALQYRYNELGVYIAEIVPGGAADTAGLQENDKLVSFNGVDINTTANLTNAIQKLEVGDTAEVVVSRNGERITVQVVMQESVAVE